MDEKRIENFQHLVWDFYYKNKRNFPWRQTENPYHILVSEVMLQQTQADRVVRYYEQWLKRFPSVESLAKASFSQIYPLWMGLGYNRRALALQKSAQKAVADYKGKFPNNIELLEEFPGIGPYTAKAVAAFAFNVPVACIETNIRRVFIHHFFPKAKQVTDEQIAKLAEQALDRTNPREWNWALMDYGAYLKTQIENPNRRHKNYTVQSKFEGSLRQIRGLALRILSAGSVKDKELAIKLQKLSQQDSVRVRKALLDLTGEKLIIYKGKSYSLYKGV